MRYQVIYSKRGLPLTFWTNSAENARKVLDDLRKAGYFAELWEHTDAGVRILNG